MITVVTTSISNSFGNFEWGLNDYNLTAYDKVYEFSVAGYGTYYVTSSSIWTVSLTQSLVELSNKVVAQVVGSVISNIDASGTQGLLSVFVDDNINGNSPQVYNYTKSSQCVCVCVCE